MFVCASVQQQCKHHSKIRNWRESSTFLCPLRLSHHYHSSYPSCFLLHVPFLTVQGQLASRDGVPVYPCCSSDSNQGVPTGQTAWSCDLLADPLAALQAHVCLWRGETHITLSHLVGSYRYAWVSLYWGIWVSHSWLIYIYLMYELKVAL